MAAQVRRTFQYSPVFHMISSLQLCCCVIAFLFCVCLFTFSNVKGTGNVYNWLRLMSIQIKDGLLVYHFITPFESLCPNKL